MKGTNTSLSALNDMLFERLETLSNPDMNFERLNFEKKRAEAMSKVSKVIVDAAALSLEAIKILRDDNPSVDVSPSIKGLLNNE